MGEKERLSEGYIKERKEGISMIHVISDSHVKTQPFLHFVERKKILP